MYRQVSASASFAESAVDAFNATKEPCNFLISRESVKPTRTPATPVLPQLTDSLALQNPPSKRKPPRQDRAARPRRADTSSRVPKSLFIRDTHVAPPLVYIIRCPDCGRSDFPGVQGLLNHCRLKHHREYGSHDALIQECAVGVPEEAQAVLVERGLEVTGMAAGLQRLFEMTLDTDERVMSLRGQRDDAGRDEEEEREGVLVTKTLGHHKDSPALAPFLGRVTERRINVYDDEQPVDIVGEDSGEMPRLGSGRAWKMSFQKRSGVRVDDEEDHEDEPTTSTHAPSRERLSSEQKLAAQVVTDPGSRFHITARLTISDWSVRLTDGKPRRGSELNALTTSVSRT